MLRRLIFPLILCYLINIPSPPVNAAYTQSHLLNPQLITGNPENNWNHAFNKTCGRVLYLLSLLYQLAIDNKNSPSIQQCDLETLILTLKNRFPDEINSYLEELNQLHKTASNLRDYVKGPDPFGEIMATYLKTFSKSYARALRKAHENGLVNLSPTFENLRFSFDEQNKTYDVSFASTPNAVKISDISQPQALVLALKDLCCVMNQFLPPKVINETPAERLQTGSSAKLYWWHWSMCHFWFLEEYFHDRIINNNIINTGDIETNLLFGQWAYTVSPDIHIPTYAGSVEIINSLIPHMPGYSGKMLNIWFAELNRQLTENTGFLNALSLDFIKNDFLTGICTMIKQILPQKHDQALADTDLCLPASTLELFKSNQGLKPFFTISQNPEHLNKFAATVVRYLTAVVEYSNNPIYTSAESITQKYSLNRDISMPLFASVENLLEHDPGLVQKGFPMEVIMEISTNVAIHYPDFKDIRYENDIIFEIASTENFPINNILKTRLAQANTFIKRVLADNQDYSQIFNDLYWHDTPKTISVVLKWLGNIAELDTYPREQSKAREFLKYFTTRVLTDNRDILDQFTDCVFEKINLAKQIYKCNSQDIKAVGMLTGAQHLTHWLNTRARQLGKAIEFQEIELTTGILNYLTRERTKNLADIIFNPGAEELLWKFLRENNIVTDSTKYILFFDVGFSATINRYLNTLWKNQPNMEIEKDFITMIFISHSSERDLTDALNKHTTWHVSNAERVLRLSHIIDDGFEASTTSPMRFIQGTTIAKSLPTPRPWFYNMTKEQIQAFASCPKPISSTIQNPCLFAA